MNRQEPATRPSRRRLPTVVLIGRPNVGKSTLFNRLSGRRRSIVTSIPGTTRDVIAQAAEWQGRRFELVDTGGMFGASEDPLHALVLERGQRAITSADLLVFVVDGRQGLVPGDRDIAMAARTSGTPVVLAVNKTDDKRSAGATLEFSQLGFDAMYEVSAEHGQGTGDLLDAVVALLGQSAVLVEETVEPDDEGVEVSDDLAPPAREEISIAIVGRPNVGKSSLVNRLLREERMIVSDTPGTTRDAVDTVMTWHRRQFRVVDTAGIRRPGRVARSGQVEMVSVLLARRAIEAADVVVVVIDASIGASDQDGAIAGEADKAGRGIILAANKWDLVKSPDPDVPKTFDEALRRQLKFLEYAPILHVSAMTGERTPRLVETIDRVAEARLQHVKTGELNAFMREITQAQPPPHQAGREVRVLYATQTRVAPPTFVFFTNIATQFHFSYERYIVNRIRERFGFLGSPIRLHVRRRM